jgi:hypothetical protein
MNNNLIKKYYKYIFIIFFSVFLTALFTWPFILKISSFYTDFGDYPSGASALWYNYQSITSGKIFNQAEYFKGYEFYPHPYTIAFSDHRFIISLIFSPIYFISSNYILSVNLTMFFLFVLTFLSSFYSVYYLIKKYYSSIVAAVIFTFNPFIFAKFPLHIESLNKLFLFPLFVFCYKFFKKPSLKNAFFFYLFFTLNSLSMLYLEIFSLVMLPIFFIPFLIYRLNDFNKFLLYIFNLIRYSLVFIVFIPILLYFNTPYISFFSKENTTRSINGNIYFSARIVDFTAPTKDNFIYKGLFNIIENKRSPRDPENNEFNYEEHTLFLNILPLIFLITFFIYRKKFTKENSLLYVSFLLILLTSLLFTFGPYFQGFINFMNRDIKLPYYYLYNYFPFFNGIRVPTRFMFMFYVPFALFAGYGSSLFFYKIKNNKFKLILLIIFILILFIENYNFKNFSSKSNIIESLSKPVLRNKLAFLNNKTTIHLPINIPNYGDDGAYLNWTVYTNEKIMNGNTGYLPPDITNFLLRIKKSFSKKEISALKALNINYIVIHKNLLNENDKKIYLGNHVLYQNAKAYEDKNILIIDLNKIMLDIKICSFDKDINKDIFLASVKNSNLTFYAVTFKNNSDCYLPNIYFNRYKVIDLNSTNFYGNKIVKKVNLRMPILINPFEMIMLSEYNGEVKID